MALKGSSNSGSSNDAALIGDTRMALAYKPLPRTEGPNYGLGGTKPSDEYRVTGNGASGSDSGSVDSEY